MNKTYFKLCMTKSHSTYIYNTNHSNQKVNF